MIKLLSKWFNRHFSDPQVILLTLFLIFGFIVLFFFGDLLTPLLIALIITYLLDGSVTFLHQKRIPRFVAILCVFSLFILVLLTTILILIPLIIRQASQFMLNIPGMLAKGEQVLLRLGENYPELNLEKNIDEFLLGMKLDVADLSQQLLSLSFSSVMDLFSFMVYLVILPLLIFFLLKDKHKILFWFQNFLPQDRKLVTRVWEEANAKILGYVRGKFLEVLIAWVVSYITFLILGLNYAMLLSFAVGISVLIPYVGAAVVTIPIAIVAYFQWGYGSDFIAVLIAYAVIQFLDGNLLVPLLFSGMVNLHPAAIIVAVLFFGGLWGIWGVFFAIPLASLIHAVINVWPRRIS